MATEEVTKVTPETYHLHARFWGVCLIPYGIWMLLLFVIVPLGVYEDVREAKSDSRHRDQILKSVFQPVKKLGKVDVRSAQPAVDLSKENGGHGSPDRAGPDPLAVEAVENFASRALCDAFVLLNGLVCLAAIGVGVGIYRIASEHIRKFSFYRSHPWFRWISPLFLLVALSYGLVALYLGKGTVETILQEAIGSQGWIYVRGFMLIWDFVSMVTALSILMAVHAILLPPFSEELSEHVKERIKTAAGNSDAPLSNRADLIKVCWIEELALYYAQRMSLLRLTLYVATAALVTNTLYISAAYHWLLAFVPGDHDSKNLLYKEASDLISGIVVMRGVFYSAVLGMIYLPAYAIFKWLAANLADEACRNAIDSNLKHSLPTAISATDAPSIPNSFPMRDNWMKARGLVADQVWHQFPQLLAILAPILAGPAGELLKSISSVGAK